MAFTIAREFYLLLTVEGYQPPTWTLGVIMALFIGAFWTGFWFTMAWMIPG